MADKNTVYFVAGGSAVAVALIYLCIRRSAKAVDNSPDEIQAEQTVPQYLGYNNPIKFDSFGLPASNSNISFGDIVMGSSGPMLPLPTPNKGACCGTSGSNLPTISSRPTPPPEIKPYESTYKSPPLESLNIPKVVDYFSCDTEIMYSALNDYATLVGAKNGQALLDGLGHYLSSFSGSGPVSLIPFTLKQACDVMNSGETYPKAVLSRDLRFVNPSFTLDGQMLKRLYGKAWERLR